MLSVSSRERERYPPEQVEEKRYLVEYERIQFGPFDFDPLSLELRRAGRRVRLRPQSARALALLLTDPLAEISREDLRTHLWEDGTYVDYETGLNTCIRRLRHALGDDARRPRFVLTIPGRGYRFIMPVTTTPEASGADEKPTPRIATVDGAPRRAHAWGWGVRTAWFVALAASAFVVFSTAGSWKEKDDGAADPQPPVALRTSSAKIGASMPMAERSNGHCPSLSPRPIYAIVARVEILKDEPKMGRALVRIFRSGLKQSPRIQLMPGPRFRTGLARLANDREGRGISRDRILRLGRVERADAVILIRVSRSPFPGNTDYFFEVEIVDVATHSLVFDVQENGATEAILARKVEQSVRRATTALHDLAPRW